MHEGQILFLALALLFGLTAGLVGCFALMKRMLLAGDVISHLALPGLGVAFLFKVNPLIGGATTLFLGTLLVWRLQKKTGLTTDATIGVVFAAALAIGAAVTPREDLIDALFGELQRVSVLGFLLGLAATLVVALSLFLLKDGLALAIFSPDLAAATGVNVDRVNLSFLLVFSLTVLVGLRFMGTLLASALIILPAAAARQVTDRLSNFLVVSVAVSLVSVLAGFLLNTFVLKLSLLGPTIVLFSAFFFAVSMWAKRA
ncbi:MAG TPA: metal ABC transporter permease [Candidatus Acidoferrales bacterium]|jgi:ABC-type Mn2+/Zn2+ transport system permease subunit|nr:metal ABC transporter permease [Candidatus Acidoferrales bacterium]